MKFIYKCAATGDILYQHDHIESVLVIISDMVTLDGNAYIATKREWVYDSFYHNYQLTCCIVTLERVL